nr:oligogalacturonide lyase [Clostridia bacterium]
MLHYDSEFYRYTDSDTGADVTRLTGFCAHSNHLYFTNNSFYDNGRRIVFESDRGNALNFFSLDLENGDIDQLTAIPPLEYPREYPFHEAFVDAVNANCCFYAGDTLYRLSIKTRELVPIYRNPDGYINHILSISPDGEYVYTSIIQNPADRTKGDLTLRAIFEAKPHSQIIRIPINGGSEKVIWEEDNFIAHVNISPTDPTMLTFCHEGPWNLVDNRLWYANTVTGEVGKLHPCKEGESIGHEYWYADGKRIGYHGHDNGRFIIGVINSDGTNDRTYDFPYRTGHTFSLDERLIVGDGNADGKYLRVWQFDGNGYKSPRALCKHNCSFRRQRAHVHPRMTPDGKAVLYTSDETGYEQVYLVKLPDDIGALPLISELAHLGAK